MIVVGLLAVMIIGTLWVARSFGVGPLRCVGAGDVNRDAWTVERGHGYDERQEESDERQKEADKLADCDVLIGKTREEVAGLLGRRANVGRDRGVWSFSAGTINGSDAVYLRVRFDDEGRVAGAKSPYD